MALDEVEEEQLNLTKGERILGARQSLDWVKDKSGKEKEMRQRIMRSKALNRLGAAYDDVRIEKALLVMGEAPGREVPAGWAPRPSGGPSRWATPAELPIDGSSVFQVACVPWLLLAPLHLLALQLSPSSPYVALLSRLAVPAEAEACHSGCAIARLYATLFWSLQFCGALGCLYLHHHRERGLAALLTASKLVVGAVLLKGYAQGVLLAPLGLGGGLLEWGLAVAFFLKMRLPV